MNTETQEEIKNAVQVLEKHFKEIILVGAHPCGNAICHVVLNGEKPFVMHGGEPEKYISMQYLPSAMLTLSKERLSRLAAVLGGFGKFLQGVVNEETNLHVIQKDK